MYATLVAKLPFAEVLPPGERAKPEPTRFAGLDLHKEYVTACIVNRVDSILLSVPHIDTPRFAAWARKNLDANTAVIIEMTTNGWFVHDLLKPFVHSVVIVHPPGMRGLMPEDAKTDTADAFALACALANGSAYRHAVWVPPVHVREMRTLLGARHKVVKMATRSKNRLHAILMRHQIDAPNDKSTPFHPDLETFWTNLPASLSAAEKLDVNLNWATLRFCDTQQKACDTLIHEKALADPAALHLLQVPGVGPILAMTILAAIGDIARFKSAKKLVGYAGLGGRVRQTGKKLWQGSLPRKGRRELRWALVQAAQHAVKSDKRWKRVYAEMLPRLGKRKAKVAIARRLLVTIWYLLSRVETDRGANPAQVAQTLMNFAYDAGPEKLPEGQSVREFVRTQLDELGIGAELKQIKVAADKMLALPPSRLPGAPPPEDYPIVEARVYPPIGCGDHQVVKRGLDGRTRAARVLNGRSKPAAKTRSCDPPTEPSG
jgi:transposase